MEERKIVNVMSGEAVSDKKPLPGLTEAKAKEHIASIVKDSLQGMPEGFCYAYYGPGGKPGDAGCSGVASVPVFGDDAPNQLYSFSVSYWAQYPPNSLPVEELYDKALAYWSAHAQAITPAKAAKSAYERYAGYITTDRYGVELIINHNHEFAISCTSPYYGRDGLGAGYPVADIITRDGGALAGKPPK
ncbi:hypothetical protein Srot_2569 [Segniliparus rotundus DSM 44985]|uniref:Uncharacterized protein n=1 Tax=Segniliparus rotundus (strain ATCC BAA-972 / CDC 1076 / CIP 108378 / DSM 44985 / JCM 13578) TaxID=640132 RepID=D6ZC37_SEGRD|nr:hypothetical protein [Segniliparus rotundus]ADG99006.1 hypothetical protein Srot_2569 [Segniliparus rotundus DSM 44985]